MLIRGYTHKYVEDYLKYGLLPRVIEATFDNYYALLTTARENCYSDEGTLYTWKNSRAEALIKHHSGKLWNVRGLASSYRSFIYETYAYLRDAAHKEYQDLELMDHIWQKFQTTSNTDGGDDGEAGGGGGSATSGRKRCSHCHRTDLHAAGKANCYGKSLTAPVARKVLKGATKRGTDPDSLTQACKEVEEEIKNHPDGDIDEIIKTARKNHLGWDK